MVTGWFSALMTVDSFLLSLQEEDSEFMVQHLANIKMKPNVQMMSSASQTTAFQPIIPAKQGKNMSRRQLFIGSISYLLRHSL